MINKKLKKMLALTLTGAMMIGFSACSSDGGNEAEQNSLETIKSRRDSGKIFRRESLWK